MMAYEDVQAEPSVGTSLGRAIEAGQRLVVNRLDLARLDVMHAVSRISRSAVFVAAGALLACVGWVALTVAAIVFGQQYMTWPASAALVGLFNAVVGAALIAFGVQRAQHEVVHEPAHHQGNGA